MRELLFNLLYKNKDGALNYDHLSKATGLTKTDLTFLLSPDFTLIDRALLICGVFVGFHSIPKNNKFDSPWSFKTCYNDPSDLVYLNSLIKNNSNYFSSPYEYFIMDSTGRILFTNCELSSSTDKHGVIHLSSPDHSIEQFVYPASIKQRKYKSFYCQGSDIDKLNTQISSYIDKKLIEKPNDFKGGFSIQETPQEKQ